MQNKKNYESSHSDIVVNGHVKGLRKVERIFKNWEPRRFLRRTKMQIRNPNLRQAVLITQETSGNFELTWFNASRTGNDLALLELAKASTLERLLKDWRDAGE